MKKLLFVILAVLAALAAGAAAQDQVTRPVIADASTGVIIWPNPAAWALANRLVQTDDASYSVLTNNTVWTGLVATVASHSATITNFGASAITSGNLAVARITNALTTGGASIGGNVPVAALTNAAGTVGSSIGGNIPAAALTNAFAATIQPAYAAGVFSVASTTQLVFIASGVTNVIDADITTP